MLGFLGLLRCLPSPLVCAALVPLVLSMRANPARAGDCLLGPIRDLKLGQQALNGWVAANDLPGYLKDESGFGLSGREARVHLQTQHGSITITWMIDAACRPRHVRSTPSADYSGPMPGDQAVLGLIDAMQGTADDIGSRFSVAGSTGTWWVCAVLLWLALLGRRQLWRGLRAGGLRVGNLWRTLPPLGKVRLIGCVAIAALLPSHSPTALGLRAWWEANGVVLYGMFPFLVLLWVSLTGYFGYGSASRRDWPALVVMVFALVVRTLYARHGVQGIELHFDYGTHVDRHSVVYAWYVTFVQGLGRDPYVTLIYANALLSSLVALPLYVFVRQRTEDTRAASFVALLYAAHPILVQMGPSDAPYGLCFLTWFLGLTLLSGTDIGAKELIGGAAMLGVAATCRAEGSLYLVASLLLLPIPRLWSGLRREPGAGLDAVLVGAGLLGLHFASVFPNHLDSSGSLPLERMSWQLVLEAGLFSTDFNDPLLVGLVWLGAVAGLVSSSLRLGVGAAVATLVVVWPFATTTFGGFTILHRLSPACMMQVLSAGVGLAWLTRPLPVRWRSHWGALAPGVLAAFYLLVAHHHEIHDPIAITDEFWMLRKHLAPGGRVLENCRLLWVGQNMDTDLSNFEQVVPGMKGVRCNAEDCPKAAAAGGCAFYIRGINCFHSWPPTAPECVEDGRTQDGGYYACMKDLCVEMERVLDLEAIESRLVDVHAVFDYDKAKPPEPHFPRRAEVVLYRVLGLKDRGAVVNEGLPREGFDAPPR